jgi:hypothetical protein
MLAHRIRAHLCKIAQTAQPITHHAFAKRLELSPPNTIHKLTVALEQSIDENVAADQPLIAALVISKAKAGLPVRGFFEYTKEIGLFYRDVSEPDASVFHEVELKKGR